MSKQNVWCGYLEAGAKSSPILRDDRLDTGNPKTVYLFNLNKGAILEYSREIIEPKLRELKPKEKEISTKLKSAFKKARTGFVPKGGTLSILTSNNTEKKEDRKNTEKDINELDETDDIQDDDEIPEIDEVETVE